MKQCSSSGGGLSEEAWESLCSAIGISLPVQNYKASGLFDGTHNKGVNFALSMDGEIYSQDHLGLTVRREGNAEYESYCGVLLWQNVEIMK